MNFPLATGQVARILKTTEPPLSEAVRRGHVDPPPRVVAGRRFWEPLHIRQAAKYLGLLTEELDQQLREEETHA